MMPTPSQCRRWPSRKSRKSSAPRPSLRSKLSRRSCSARRKPWLRCRPCWCCEKSGKPSVWTTRKADQRPAPAHGDRTDQRGACRWRGSGLMAPTVCGDGISAFCRPRCVVRGCTSIWWAKCGAAKWSLGMWHRSSRLRSCLIWCSGLASMSTITGRGDLALAKASKHP